MAVVLAGSLIAGSADAAAPADDEVVALRSSAQSSLEIGEPEQALEQLLAAHGKATDSAIKLEIAVDIARVRVQVFRVTGDKTQLSRAESLLVTQFEALGPNDLRRAGVTAALEEVRAVAGDSTNEGSVADPTAAEATPPVSAATPSTEDVPFYTPAEISRAGSKLGRGETLPECADPSSLACRTLVDKGSADLYKRGKSKSIEGGVIALLGLTVGIPIGAWLLATGLKLQKLEKQCEDLVGSSEDACSNGAQGRIVGGVVALMMGGGFLLGGPIGIAQGNKTQAKATAIRNQYQLSFAPIIGRSQAGISFGGRF